MPKILTEEELKTSLLMSDIGVFDYHHTALALYAERERYREALLRCQATFRTQKRRPPQELIDALTLTPGAVVGEGCVHEAGIQGCSVIGQNGGTEVK